MSLHFELVSECAYHLILERLRHGRIGSVPLGPLEATRLGTFRGKWEYRVYSVKELTEGFQNEIRQTFGLRNPQTRVCIYCDVKEPAEDAVYQMTLAALKEWEGDFALLINGDHLSVKRVDGKLTLYKKNIYGHNFALFQPPYEVVDD